MKYLLIILLASFNLIATSPESLQKELQIYTEKPVEATCHLYLVHHGSTEWAEQGRLQGWANLPLSEKGKKEITQTSSSLQNIPISAIYSSSLQSSLETSQMLQETIHCPIYPVENLRGEFHGDFEGFTQAEYEKEPHFQYYDSLNPSDEIFYPCGKNGESKADFARRAFPEIKKIASKHIGENIVIVLHGGSFKLLNYYQGIYSEEEGTIAIPNGGIMLIEANEHGLYLDR